MVFDKEQSLFRMNWCPALGDFLAVVSGSVWHCTLPPCGGICRRYVEYGGFVILDLFFSFPFLAKAILYVPRVYFTLCGLNNRGALALS